MISSKLPVRTTNYRSLASQLLVLLAPPLALMMLLLGMMLG
ncbi:MAG: hypothetical protein R3E89_11060 [Thiolinea sp.]